MKKYWDKNQKIPLDLACGLLFCACSITGDKKDFSSGFKIEI